MVKVFTVDSVDVLILNNWPFYFLSNSIGEDKNCISFNIEHNSYGIISYKAHEMTKVNKANEKTNVMIQTTNMIYKYSAINDNHWITFSLR